MQRRFQDRICICLYADVRRGVSARQRHDQQPAHETVRPEPGYGDRGQMQNLAHVHVLAMTWIAA